VCLVLSQLLELVVVAVSEGAGLGRSQNRLIFSSTNELNNWPPFPYTESTLCSPYYTSLIRVEIWPICRVKTPAVFRRICVESTTFTARAAEQNLPRLFYLPGHHWSRGMLLLRCSGTRIGVVPRSVSTSDMGCPVPMPSLSCQGS
jgi:hypothetical protein